MRLLFAHGAVLCLWEIYALTKAAADICFPNGLWPVTKAGLKDRLAERMGRVRAGSAGCISSRQYFLEPYDKELKSKSGSEAKSSFEKTLAVPQLG